jgi:hypothetical protein
MNIMDIKNSDLLKETNDFVENIEFCDNIQPKAEIKEEEGFNQEVWKSLPLDIKPKLEQIEASKTGQVKIKTEPEEFVGNDETETLCNKSIEIKDEFMWAMKIFVSYNVPSKNNEEKIVAVPEKKSTVRFTLKAGENNPRKNLALQKRPYKCENIADVHENDMPFVCSGFPSKLPPKHQSSRHIAAVNEMKKAFECSLCPYKVGLFEYTRCYCT